MDQQDWTRIMDVWGEADHVKWAQIIHEWNERLRKERYSRDSEVEYETNLTTIQKQAKRIDQLEWLYEQSRLTWEDNKARLDQANGRIAELEAQVAKLKHLKEEYRLSWNAAEDRVLELEKELEKIRWILAPLANHAQSGWAFGLSRSETLAEVQRVARAIVEREYLTLWITSSTS